MRTLVLLAACVGCSSPSSSPPAPDAAARDAAVDAVPPATPGVFATIAGGQYAGTYALTGTVECNLDSEIHDYRLFGRTGDMDLTLFSTMEPEAGQRFSSPDFWVIVFTGGQGTFYPQDTGGSCTTTVDASWPAARYHFSCTGGPFTITGTGVCPPV
jgi:hypothetical protein